MRTLAFLFFCLFCSFVPARAESPPETAPCTPAARLFGETICEESLVPDGFTSDMLAHIPDGIDGQSIRDSLAARKIEKLKDAIWKKGLIHKFGAAAVEPSDEDISIFQEKFNAGMDEDYERDRMTAVYTRELLDKNKYSADAEKKIRGLLDAANASMKLYEQRKRHLEGMPEEYKFVAETANKQVVSTVLADWKSDKILYDAYGGEVFLTINGVLPLGARAKQLDYIRKDGKLEILNPAFKDVLKPFDDQIADPDNRALFPDKAKEWAEKHLSTPGPHSPMPGSNQRFQSLKNDLDSIPVLGPQ